MVLCDYDCNNLAPTAEKTLASTFGAFNLSYKASLVAHNQGIYVLRVMAQDIPSCKQVFENVFMITADVCSHGLSQVNSTLLLSDTI